MDNLNEKVERLAQLITKETAERLKESFKDCPEGAAIQMVFQYSTICVKPGLKYIKVDIGGSGKYMVEVSTQDIYGIKAYGQIHRGHYYGTLDTIDQYYWGDYTAFKKN